MPGCNEMRLGAIAQPKVMQELQRIGRYIKAQASPLQMIESKATVYPPSPSPS